MPGETGRPDAGSPPHGPNAFACVPPFVPDRTQDILSASLAQHTGPDAYSSNVVAVPDLGRVGAIAGWKGEEDAPPEPMVIRTADAPAACRAVEVVPKCGHTSYVQAPRAFDDTLYRHLRPGAEGADVRRSRTICAPR